jgi:hypothetical protein
MKTKNDVLGMIQCMMGCHTPAYVADQNNNNAAYVCYPVDSLLDEDSVDYLMSEDWELMDFSVAPADMNMDLWAQEFSQNLIEDLKRSLKKWRIVYSQFF